MGGANSELRSTDSEVESMLKVVSIAMKSTGEDTAMSAKLGEGVGGTGDTLVTCGNGSDELSSVETSGAATSRVEDCTVVGVASPEVGVVTNTVERGSPSSSEDCSGLRKRSEVITMTTSVEEGGGGGRREVCWNVDDGSKREVGVERALKSVVRDGMATTFDNDVIGASIESGNSRNCEVASSPNKGVDTATNDSSVDVATVVMAIGGLLDDGECVRGEGVRGGGGILLLVNGSNSGN